MQKPERRKKYKDHEPEKTVAYIGQLLSDFGIEVREQYYHIDTADINSLRVRIADPRLWELNIGTNGKGMDLKYTRASAYGEFMERLANNLLLPGDDTNTEGQFFLSKAEAAPRVKAYCREVFGENETVSDYYLNDVAGDEIKFQSFTDAFTGEDTPLPLPLLRLMTGSNGMCAGNSRNEAVLQGISEIFERHVCYELTVHHVIPPEIDRKVFEGTAIYDRLAALEQAGYRCRVLDLSLGKGFPVIGIILYHGNGYRARLGADPSPITALERCFTEIFQGCNEISDSLFTDIDHQRADMASATETDRDLWFRQYIRAVSDGSGYFPLGLVTEMAVPDYAFNGFEHPISVSNEDDLRYYMDVIARSGKKLYICDRSALGFPAYYTLIPSFSEFMITDDGGALFRDRLECRKELEGLTRVHSMSREELLRLADALEKWFGLYDATQNYVNSLYEYCHYEWYHKYKVLAYLCACGGNREKADKYLEKYFETYDGQRDRQLFVRKKAAAGDAEQCFPRDQWPLCPNCEACGMKDKCRLEDVKKLNAHIRAAAAERRAKP